MKKLILGFMVLAAVSSAAIARTTIVTDTKDWVAVPVTVEGSNYTVVGTMPASGTNYYYSYKDPKEVSYRCVTKANKTYGTVVTYTPGGTATVSGGDSIYCYPE